MTCRIFRKLFLGKEQDRRTEGQGLHSKGKVIRISENIHIFAPVYVSK